MVEGAYAIQRLGSLTRPPVAVRDRAYRLEQRFEFGDIVEVAAGQRERQRDTCPLGQDVVLRAWADTPTGLGPLSGRASLPPTCEESITALDQILSGPQYPGYGPKLLIGRCRSPTEATGCDR